MENLSTYLDAFEAVVVAVVPWILLPLALLTFAMMAFDVLTKPDPWIDALVKATMEAK